MEWIDYAAPKTITEAVGLLASKKNRAMVMAGATDILVQMRAGRRSAGLLVDVKDIPELNQISYDPQKGLMLGAAVPCFRIYGNQVVTSTYPGLIDAVSSIGGVQIQGRASVGGNLCNAAPSGDSIPPVIVLGGVCHIVGLGGRRQLPAEEFCTGPGQNALQPSEILVSINLPPPQAHSGASYLRFTPRNEMDIAVAGVGCSVVLDASGENVVSARIALSAVAPTPVLAREAGDSLAGKPVSDASILEATEKAMAAAKPIDDMRGTIRQRIHLVGVLTRRSLNTAIQRARGN